MNNRNRGGFGSIKPPAKTSLSCSNKLVHANSPFLSWVEVWPDFQSDLGFSSFSVDLCYLFFLPKAEFMFLMVSYPNYGEDRKYVQPIPSCLKP